MRISDWSSDVCSSDLVDITYPAERMRFLFDDARPVCLVTTGDFRRDLPSEIIESGIDIVELGSPEIAVRLDHSAPHRITDADRSAERRVGKELVRTCRLRWSTVHTKQHYQTKH